MTLQESTTEQDLTEALRELASLGFVVVNAGQDGAWWESHTPTGWTVWIRRPGGLEAAKGRSSTLAGALREALRTATKRGLGAIRPPAGPTIIETFRPNTGRALPRRALYVEVPFDAPTPPNEEDLF